ncbi:hypothetical protein J4E91_006739 [Alternaria rosae]|nr:hypothetical protein J4E91_006739 [Alternaria rosae]
MRYLYSGEYNINFCEMAATKVKLDKPLKLSSYVLTRTIDEDAFPVAIDHVFSTTVPSDTGLRNIVIQTISKNMAVVKKPETQTLVTKYGDLAVGILLKRMN